MTKIGYDYNEYEAYEGFVEVPAGDYVACVSDVDDRGHGILFKFTILDGEQKDSTVTEFLNLGHETARTKEIARKQGRALIDACGKQGVQEWEELINIPFHLERKKYKDNMNNYFSSLQNEQVKKPAPATKRAASSGSGRPQW